MGLQGGSFLEPGKNDCVMFNVTLLTLRLKHREKRLGDNNPVSNTDRCLLTSKINKRTEPWLVECAGSWDVKTPTVTGVRLPTWRHRVLEQGKGGTQWAQEAFPQQWFGWCHYGPCFFLCTLSKFSVMQEEGKEHVCRERRHPGEWPLSECGRSLMVLCKTPGLSLCTPDYVHSCHLVPHGGQWLSDASEHQRGQAVLCLDTAHPAPWECCSLSEKEGQDGTRRQPLGPWPAAPRTPPRQTHFLESSDVFS